MRGCEEEALPQRAATLSSTSDGRPTKSAECEEGPKPHQPRRDVPGTLQAVAPAKQEL
jgi:hypothetical protein